MTHRILIIAVAMAAVVGSLAWMAGNEVTSSQAPSPPRSVVTVAKGPLDTRVSETGTLQPSRTLEIKSQFSGEVAELLVSQGQAVEEGQLLAIIAQEPKEARQVAQLRAAIQEERIHVETARRELVRMQTLFDKGFVARKERESAEQEHQRRLVRLELAERQLLLALGGNRDLYQRYLANPLSPNRPEEFQVRSPSRGTILDVLVQPGEIITSGTATVGGGTVLMRVADLQQMVVKANINEVSIARVRVGQPVNIQLDALLGETFHGTVSHISTQGAKEDNLVTFDVTVAIEHPTDVLRPMLTANIDIVTETLDDVLTIPLETLRTEHGDDLVDVLVDDTPRPRKVRVAFRTDAHAVIAEGLQEGDQVVRPTYAASGDATR